MLDFVNSSILWRGGEKKLKLASPNGAELLCSNGKAPEVGQIFQNPTLAQTFREIGDKGKQGFYEGRIAQAIVDGGSPFPLDVPSPCPELIRYVIISPQRERWSS